MNTDIVSDSIAIRNIENPFEQFYRLATVLHRGCPDGQQWFGLIWTPNSGEFYTTEQGEQIELKISHWVPTKRPLFVPAGWHSGKNLYFGVNPSSERTKRTKSSTNDKIAASNSFLAEFDGKDYIDEAAWLPQYKEPDLTGLSAAKARGALQKAQTAAIDATYKLDPEKYKQRAYEHLQGLPIKPSAVWASGGGYQAVWLLTETQYITDDESRARLAHYQREWVHKVGGDPAAVDLRRVLRVPGSRNHKPKYAPNYPEVSFLWCDLDLRYNFADLIADLPEPTAPSKAVRRSVHIPESAPIELSSIGEVPDLPRHAAIEEYNKNTVLRDLLLSLGYTVHSQGRNRLNRPGGDSGGVELHDDNSATVYSSGDPLFCGHRIRPAHVLCVYEYAGDVGAMLGDLAKTQKEQLNRLRQWVRRADFSEHVPIMLQAANGYRTSDSDKAHALALLAIFEEYGTSSGPVGLSQLSELTGRSLQTCANARRRLEGWFIECLSESDRAKNEAPVYRLNQSLCESVSRRLETTSVGSNNSEGFLIYATLPMDTHRAHDAFVRSMRPLDDDELAERIEQRKAMGKAAKATGDERRRLKATLPSAGPAALPVVDALTEFGQMTYADIAERTGRKRGSIYRAVARLAQLELVTVHRGDGFLTPDEISLNDDWVERVEQITPAMPTHGTVRRRIDARLDRTIAQCEEAMKTSTPELCKALFKRSERAKKRKVDLAKADGFTSKAALKAAAHRNNSLTWWDKKRIDQLGERHAIARMDVAEQRRREGWNLTGRVQAMRSEGFNKHEIARQLGYAEYAPREIWTAINQVWKSSSHSSVEVSA